MTTQYALPIDFRDLKKLETEIEIKLEENKTNQDLRFINSEIKKALKARTELDSNVTIMDKVAGDYKLEAYIDRVVLPLPNQEPKEARYLVGVRSHESKMASSKKVESYYFAADIRKNSKKIVEELCQAFTGRQSAKDIVI